MLLNNRRILQVKQIDIENEIRGTLRVFGIKLAGRITGGPFEARVLDAIESVRRLAAMVKPMLIARAAIRQQCAVLQKMLLETTCRRLMTIPGVGAITAVTYVTTIDDPARFEQSRDVGPTLGSRRKSMRRARLTETVASRRVVMPQCGLLSIKPVSPY